MNREYHFRHASGNLIPGETNAHRQDLVCSTHGFPSVDYVHPDRQPLRWRFQSADAALYRTLSGHGFCSTDLPRKSTRYRSMFIGPIPSFIHISDGKMHDVNVLDLLAPEAGAIYVMDRAYVDFARLHTLHQAGAFFVTRAKSNLNAHRVYSASKDRASGIICDRPSPWMGFIPSRTIPTICDASVSKTQKPARHWCF